MASIKPVSYYTRWYASADGQTIALCTYHVRTREMIGGEFQPLHADLKDDDCGEACVDCKERQRLKGDLFNLPLSDLWTMIAENCDVISYSLEDMLSTLEILCQRMKEQAHVDQIETAQKTIRGLVDLFDTTLNENHSLSGKLSAMLDDDGNEVVPDDDLEDDQ